MRKPFKKNHKKIGILGGTFDPAHIGHIKISREAKNKFKLDYIIWAVTKKNPFKNKSKLNLNLRIKYAKKIILKLVSLEELLILLTKVTCIFLKLP